MRTRPEAEGVSLPQDDETLVARLGSEADPLTDDAITGAHRVWQRARGHRYSLDDVLTAFVAANARPEAETHVDLGCGLGSVVTMVAYKLERARHVAVEAQAVSHELARRNLERNGLTPRVTLHRGDLRDAALLDRIGGPFALVTGTPPYVIPGRSTPAPDPQKAYARIEYRGGIEDYLEAAARVLAASGRAVVCGDARHPERAFRGAERAGLACIARLDAVPRAGQAALFSVFTFAHAAEAAALPFRHEAPFVARDAEGRRTLAYLALRTFFGLPPSHDPRD